MSASLFRPGHHRAVAAAAAGIAGIALLAACSSSGGASAGSTSAAAPASSASSAAASSAASSAAGSSSAAGAVDLSSVCPSTIKIQTSWFPNGDKAPIYNIIGPNGTQDLKKGTYTGKVDGVTVQILAGGPFVDNQSAIAQMYANSSIMFGEVSTDDAIEASAQHPVIAVVAPMQKSPKAVIFDPAVYQFKTLADVGKSGAKILKSGEDASTDLLVANGSIKASQLDYSYDGSPGMFVASGGKDVIIDYASEAIYQLENLKQWGKPMDSILLASGGYTSYEDSLTVTPATEQKYSACLQKFVPVMQQAFVDFVKNPTPMNQTIVTYSGGLKNYQNVTLASTVAADKVLTEQGILANGTDGVAGSFDTARVTDLIKRMSSVQSKLKSDIPSTLAASSVVTDKFLDTSIKFGS